MSERNAPAPDEIEISVFGRGYGESILIHYGDNKWVLIDSLKDQDQKATAIRYLEEIGVDVATGIKLILVTHWHDDHIAGVSEAYSLAAPDCRIAMPLPMNSPQLEAFKGKARKVRTKKISSGVSELDNIAKIRDAESRLPVKLAKEGSTLLQDSTMTHQKDVRFEAVSPSDASAQEFLKSVAYSIEHIDGVRAEPFAHNDISVALWISIGDVRILLGADLETTDDKLQGWDGVLACGIAPTIKKSGVFKIPHHGSKTGHHDGVWKELLEDSPISVLTTWNRGSKLPTEDDIARIAASSKEVYVTSRPSQKTQLPLKAVDRRLDQIGAVVRSRPDKAGQVRLRLKIGDGASWKVDLFNGAERLTKPDKMATT